jgi:hypothetical protein
LFIRRLDLGLFIKCKSNCLIPKITQTYGPGCG